MLQYDFYTPFYVLDLRLSNILHGYYIQLSLDIALLTLEFKIAWLTGKLLYADWVTATSTDNSYYGLDNWGSYRLFVC